MNELLDEGLELHPLEIQRENVRQWRSIGLGIMGLADALIKMKVRYGDPAIPFLNKLGKTLINSAVLSSSKLAKEYGPYPAYDWSSHETQFAQTILEPSVLDMVKQYGLRNNQLLTIAPTGTISTLLGISGGAEPIFETSYTRKTESLHNEDMYYKVYTPIVRKYMEQHGIENEEELPDFFVTSQTLPYQERIHVQATLQNYIDAAISSTINLPESATVNDIYNIYMMGWEAGLKGVTVFRNNCKRVGILTIEDKEEEKETPYVEEEVGPLRGEITEVKEGLDYRKFKLQSGCGSLYLFVGVDPETRTISDVFTNTNGAGGCIINTQANSRLISLLLRSGVTVEDITRQLSRAGTCAAYQYARGRGVKVSPGKSCPSAIANVLLDVQKELTGSLKEKKKKKIPEEDSVACALRPLGPNGGCPSCGEALAFQGGCNSCQYCGWSRCG